MFNKVFSPVNDWIFNTNTEQAYILELPEELLTDIFKMLPCGQDRLNFSLVCSRFSKIAAANMSAIDDLLRGVYHEVIFAQENNICTFITVGSPKNKPEVVITADDDSSNRDPLVTFWENGHAPVNEKTIWCSKTGYRPSLFPPYFYKRIPFLAIGGQLDNYLTAAQYHDHGNGRIQIWDIKKRIKILEKRMDKKMTSLCGNKDELFIGFSDGKVQISKFSNLSAVKEWEAFPSNYKVTKIFIASSIQRLFTQSNSTLKIWNIQNFECLAELNDIDWVNSIYDSKSQYFLHGSVQNTRNVTLRAGNDGAEIATWTESNKTAHLKGLHFDAESGLLFAAFSTKENDSLDGSKLTIWDTKTKEVVSSFLTFTEPLPKPALYEYVYQIDFDPKSRLILTRTHFVSLWKLDGTLVKKFSLDGTTTQMRWEKEAQKLFVLTDGKLHLIDYSRSPFKVLTPDSNEEH